MKTKAKVVWFAAVTLLACFGRAQSANQPAVPTVARGEVTGSFIPSSNLPVGDARGSTSARATAEKPAREKAASVVPPDTDRSLEAARARVGEVEENPANGPKVELDTGAVVMNTTALSQQIRALRHSGREELLLQLEARVSGGERELDEIRQSAPRLTGEARTAYRAALKDLKIKRDALKQALKTARKAAPGSWDAARTALADHYEAYSISLTLLESVSAASVLR